MKNVSDDIKNSFSLLKNIEKLLGKLSEEQYLKLLAGEGEICYRDSTVEVGLKAQRKAAVKKEFDVAELDMLINQMRAMRELAELKKFVAKNKFDKSILLAMAERCSVKCASKDTKDAVVGKLHYSWVGFGADWNAVEQGVQG